MSWLKKDATGPRTQNKREVPEGLWVKCDECGEILYQKDLERNLFCCPKCGHHFRITAREYVESLLDAGGIEEFGNDIQSGDPLQFKDSKRYPDRVRAAMAKTGLNDAVLTGVGRLEGRRVVVAFMDFSFIGGSMGSVVGEKIARAIVRARDERIPVLILSASGGARMMEGILSLMQMAKTSALLGKSGDGHPFLSIRRTRPAESRPRSPRWGRHRWRTEGWSVSPAARHPGDGERGAAAGLPDLGIRDAARHDRPDRAAGRAEEARWPGCSAG